MCFSLLIFSKSCSNLIKHVKFFETGKVAECFDILNFLHPTYCCSVTLACKLDSVLKIYQSVIAHTKRGLVLKSNLPKLVLAQQISTKF